MCVPGSMVNIYNLLLEHNATRESIERGLMMWFLAIQKSAAIKY